MRHKEQKPPSGPVGIEYAIQAGSFSEREGALRFVSALRDKGFDAYVYESWGKKDPSRLWKSARIGRFSDRESAYAALEQYKRREKNAGAYVTNNEISVKRGEGEPQKPAAPVRSVQRTVSQKKPPTDTSVPGNMSTAEGRNRAEAEHLFQRSIAARGSKNVRQEESLLRQALKKDTTHRLARPRLARIMVESGRIPDGLAILKGAIRGRSSAVLVGEDPNLAAFLAALYQQQNKHWKALDLYRTLLQRFPSKGIWRMGLAISMEKLGKKGQARRAYEEALISGDLSLKLRNFTQQRIQKLK